MREQIQAAIARLDAQGKQSREPDGLCLYRGPDNCVCFAGALMKDEFYNPMMEGNVVSDPKVEQALEDSLGFVLTEQDLNLLYQLQRVHDDFWRVGHETFSEAIERRREDQSTLDDGLKEIGL